jgi:hypothetical protein
MRAAHRRRLGSSLLPVGIDVVPSEDRSRANRAMGPVGLRAAPSAAREGRRGERPRRAVCENTTALVGGGAKRRIIVRRPLVTAVGGDHTDAQAAARQRAETPGGGKVTGSRGDLSLMIADAGGQPDRRRSARAPQHHPVSFVGQEPSHRRATIEVCGV